MGQTEKGHRNEHDMIVLIRLLGAASLLQTEDTTDTSRLSGGDEARSSLSRMDSGIGVYILA